MSWDLEMVTEGVSGIRLTSSFGPCLHFYGSTISSQFQPSLGRIRDKSSFVYTVIAVALSG
jgi:hypothetical protein